MRIIPPIDLTMDRGIIIEGNIVRWTVDPDGLFIIMKISGETVRCITATSAIEEILRDIAEHHPWLARISRLAQYVPVIAAVMPARVTLVHLREKTIVCSEDWAKGPGGPALGDACTRELMERTWAPHRHVDWCLDVDERRDIFLH
jgi:hypothetical protein